MAITPASGMNAAPQMQTLASNYIDFAGGGTDGTWASQYLPDLMEKEAEVFGNRTVSGFLAQVGAEEPMQADQVIWSEQGRLHLAYKCHVISNTDQNTGSNNGGEIQIETDMDGNAAQANHGLRVNDVVLFSDSNTTIRCIVTEVANDGTVVTGHVSLAVYDAGNSTATLANAGISATGETDDAVTHTILVIGSEYAKGKHGRDGANKPSHKSFSNKPIILKDKYEISGSDASQIGWVEVTSEEGASGYLWYVKAESETRLRFADYCEMMCLEGIMGDTDQSEVDALLGDTSTDNFGTEGLFAALESRGNITDGVATSTDSLSEFDDIIAELDKQGAIEENMLFLNRTTSLVIDDMLSLVNGGVTSGGLFGTSGATSFGVFDNDADMALNLGFTGFRRGSYDFYKSDWKYLNQLDGRGGINDRDSNNAIRGVLVPAGVTSVYDQMLGKNMKRPFLHVRYRASQTDDRRFKTWTTGSVGALTSDLDAMEMHYLSERCLVTQGANNFFLFKGTGS